MQNDKRERNRKIENIRSYFKMSYGFALCLDYRKIELCEFLQSGQTINKEYYSNIMRRLRKAVRK